MWLLLLVSACYGSLMSTGDLPTILAQASITIPANPQALVVPTIRDYSQVTWNGDFMVLGGQGDGTLVFGVELWGESFGGSPTGEYMQSYSDLSIPVRIQSQPAIQGSTPTWGEFYEPFTYGVMQPITLSGDAMVSYSFYPQVPGVLPYLNGELKSFVSVYPERVVGCDGCTISFAPEPATIWIGLILVLYCIKYSFSRG